MKSNFSLEKWIKYDHHFTQVTHKEPSILWHELALALAILATAALMLYAW